MAPEATNLLSTALAFPSHERAKIAHELLLNLDDGADADAADAWAGELDQRALEVRSGSVATADWETVKARLAQRWRRRWDGRLRLHPGAAADLTRAGDWYEFQCPGSGPTSPTTWTTRWTPSPSSR